jgi:hypothetical protein
MISKELLSEVLNEEIYICDFRNGHCICSTKYEYECAVVRHINIYELAHKCKEWAWKNDYALVVSPNDIEVYSLVDGRTVHNANDFHGEYPYNVAFIFKACQWILEHRINNDSMY